jgi:hypothetical protein
MENLKEEERDYTAMKLYKTLFKLKKSGANKRDISYAEYKLKEHFVNQEIKRLNEEESNLNTFKTEN